MAEVRGRTPGVDSARRALKVLLLFSGQSPRLTMEEIARGVGISTPSAYRFVSLLRELDLVEEDDGSTYVLSPRVLALAENAERTMRMSHLLRPLVERLSSVTGETALVIRRVGDFATCTEISQADRSIRLSFQPGQIMSLHQGAGPKALLAGMGKEWAARYFDRLKSKPPQYDRDAVLAELPVITSQGWSQSSAEVDEDVWAVAAPITVANKVVAALSVAGPHYRIDEKRASMIREEVISGASEVSRSLNTWHD
ncbi:DNA-binding IclR family transcriptional regulator [Spinactinospora alkalitolerans]|uniref:DNA-binding IclR family transcriptional regulator n=1 Tax=Spinactinospora alkalitolerans TaxID=687207 RepID=A0A852TRH0_9ACTN|nr:IclR family transcriptional regulator [Spinactinospora alkalitolerans]NYE45442.1 DNA-binding IclR family transcriptional regulator [Spinactinospora alkalitolerans]